MKKTVNVNLGGYPFIMDEDAYASLKAYIDDIASRLMAEDAETLADVESRLAEIFNASLNLRVQVVDLRMVCDGIETMGSADEFGQRDARKSRSEPPKQSSSRRLYRDTANGVIGGVCAGLADYLSIDVSVVRLIAILFFLFGGGGLVAYVVMWIVVPRKTIEI